MINMIQNAKDQVAALAMSAYQAAVADGQHGHRTACPWHGRGKTGGLAGQLPFRAGFRLNGILLRSSARRQGRQGQSS